MVKNILIWDEPYITYIITLASFAIGIVFLIVPWAFIIRWTSRIVAWLLLGPHMKLVDIYYFQKLAELSEDEQREQIRQTLTTQLKTAQAYAAMARVERENAVKLKDVKEALYGKFVSKIPVISNTRFVDIPLHSSTATPYKAPENLPRATTERVRKYSVDRLVVVAIFPVYPACLTNFCSCNSATTSRSTPCGHYDS